MTSTDIMQFIESLGINYSLIEVLFADNFDNVISSARIPRENVAATTLLSDGESLYLAVAPASSKLDCSRLSKVMGQDMFLTSIETVNRVFPGVSRDALPPLGQVLGLRTIVDKRFDDMENVFFLAGNYRYLIRVSGEDFRKLQNAAMHLEDFTTSLEEENKQVDENNFLPVLKHRVQNLSELPVMPRVAQELLQLRTNIDANVNDLARVVQMDPSLAAQVIRHANSPMHGYKGEIRTIQDAIARVLGYEVVMDMALGVALGKSLKMPQDGPLGLDAFWRHATYTASLAQRLGKSMHPAHQPQPGLIYLCGLLHNFGLLVLGHMFTSEFVMLSKSVEKNPQVPVHIIEKKLFGITHMEIGKWLMNAWHMPIEVITATRRHHDPDYSNDYYKYANLVLLADRLLGFYDTADVRQRNLPTEVLNRLGLNWDQAVRAYQQTMQDKNTLDALAVQMAV
jgi:HD-like signal output (HDOD) protein/prolyl-tRNA editing enzyme YbaK/EbsC (Cys-tRNA(Pro) deacylase)